MDMNLPGNGDFFESNFHGKHIIDGETTIEIPIVNGIGHHELFD